MPEPSERTALYRHYDANNGLLYIGVSKNPQTRWMAHRGNREPWIHHSVRRVDEWYDSREQALAAEEVAIRTERPPFNGKHNYNDVPFDPASWPQVKGKRHVVAVADLMRQEVTSGRWPLGYRIPPLKALAAATGVSPQLVSEASAVLQREGWLRFEAGHGLFAQQRPKLPHNWFHRFGFPG
ncbi:GntR family transcriptional regulator [Streptomyces huasconensis]|uniref:GntR family transcriptional regulator n=1 Tax=Streptomyces huasconensis TaxID=1854574 RepID=A0ABV3M348_9ACTN